MIRAIIVTISAVGLILAGCGDGRSLQNPQMEDQCLRTEIFMSCLDHLPKGPDQTHYSDWDEAIYQCRLASFKQALRPRDQIKKECRPWEPKEED